MANKPPTRPPIQTPKPKRPPKLKGKPTAPNAKWNDDYYVEFDRYLSEGMTVHEACDALGVNYNTFNEWLRSMPSLKKIVNRHRKTANGNAKKGRAVTTFMDFVYRRLPEELRDYWDRLTEFAREPTAGGKIQALMEEAGEAAWQRLFLYAVVATNFKMSIAMGRCMVSKKKLDSWKLDPNFGDLLAELEFHQQNFCEGALMQLVAEGSPVAVIFSNRALNPQKYNPTKHVNVNDGRDRDSLDLSQLSEATRLQIFREIRQARQQTQLPAITAEAITVVIPPQSSEEASDE